MSASDYLENVLENSPNAIGIVDRSGKFIKWNRMAEELYGYTFAELKGKSSFDLYADVEVLDGMLAKLRAKGSVRNYEIAMRKKDGSVIPCEVSISLLRDNENRLVGSVCVARDISDLKRALSSLEKSNVQLQQEIAERRRALEALKESQNQYRAIFENTGTATVIIEEDTTISLANTEFVKLSSYSREEIEGKMSWTQFFVGDDLIWMKEYHHLRRIDPLLAPRNYEASFKNRYGVARDVYVTVATIPLTKKSVASFLDITERKRAEDALKQSNYEISQLNEMLDLLQVCHDYDEIWSIIGHYALKLFPHDSGFLGLVNESRTALDVVTSWGRIRTESHEFNFEDCWALRQGKMHVVEEQSDGMICHHLSHSLPPFGYLCIPMIAQGEVMGLFHIQEPALDAKRRSEVRLDQSMRSKERLARAVTDHTALALANLNLRKTLRMQSICDPLTGLLNRRFMEESLQKEIARAKRHGIPLEVLMIDVDHFKRFNDTHGHEAGDLVLSRLGAFLNAHIRKEDIACRYGGEEFILILPGASMETALQRAEYLREKVKRLRLHYRGIPLESITISVGVAALSDTHPTLGDLLNAADAALYCAKSAGRDCVMIDHD